MSDQAPFAGDAGFGGGSDRLSIKSGGGCLMLFGLPFFVAGLFVMTSPFWTQQSGKPPPVFFAIPFGLVFATVGAAIMFGRAGITIDRREGKLKTWWGLLVPFRSTQYPLEDLEVVTITREIRRSDKSTYTVYPVRLSGPDKPIKIEEPRDYNAARKRAEEIAKFLNLGVEDSSSGSMVKREAGTLDESVRDRLLRTGEAVDLPERPENCKTQYRTAGDALVIDVPPLGFGVKQIIMLVVGLIFPGFVSVAFLAPMLSGGSGPPLPFMIFIGVFFIALPLLLVWGHALGSAVARSTVTVSSDALEVRRKGLLFGKTIRITMAELEELEIGGGRRGARSSAFFGAGSIIKARSDRGSVEFGAGLAKQELEWLCDVIRYMAVTDA